MNYTPTEIATRNMVANHFGLGNDLILNTTLAAIPKSDMAEFQALVQSMLVGPAGDLTGTLEATETCDCKWLDGYLAAVQDVTDAVVIPSPSLTDDQRAFFMLGVDTLKEGVRKHGEKIANEDDDGESEPDFFDLLAKMLTGVPAKG